MGMNHNGTLCRESYFIMRNLCFTLVEVAPEGRFPRMGLIPKSAEVEARGQVNHGIMCSELRGKRVSLSLNARRRL